MYNKRASLEISIQTIVIVVLAMTILGLGLVFIRNQFGGLGNIQDEIQESVKQKIIDDLLQNEKPVSFPRTQINIDKGKSEILAIGIKNKKDTPLYYKMRFTAISGPENQPLASDFLNDWFQLQEYSQQSYKLDAAALEVRSVRLSVPTRAASGSYYLNFEVVDDDLNEIYAQKDFFIFVRG